MKTVLFLSTGNYYRSRFAEILFNSIAPRYGLPWKAESRGLGVEWADHIGRLPNTRSWAWNLLILKSMPTPDLRCKPPSPTWKRLTSSSG